MINEIINNLKSIRIKNRITMVELSNKTGISQKHISNIENFKTTPSIDTLQKLADGLGYKIELSLIGDKNTA
ncbi:helix-turn-helix transcriptional regulator [Crassaminicella thermophila]|uniref:Helix-turn-helix transcriptional regulator n=1 Tax=Crassaminicella thermophila TaxID=2599308 RepID=A0A5C0SFG5_CRATE|nr:helix-turn-helix transcriptional regulator [Crassaminicella thermophila]QEK12622.1 helix-turn-helix transcriptional regulator [Crassaminicella thermophila]